MAITGLGLPSMFDTQDALSRRMEDDAMAAGNLPLGGGMMYASSMKGDLENRSLMGLASLMGGKGDPMMEKQKAIDSVMQKFGRQPETADDYRKVASMFNEIGQYEFGEKAMAMSASITAAQPQPDKPAVDIEKYNEAVAGGYKGTFMQFMLDLKNAGRASNVQFGSIPAGYELMQNDKGGYEMKVIPGGPADQEQIELSEKKIKEKVRAQMKGNLVLKNINLVRANINNPDTFLGFEIPVTGFGSWLKDVPNTQAKGTAGMINTIKANIGFAELNDMRKASPTGGALGQVSERELMFLQSVIGSLDQAQSQEDVLRVLGDVEYWYNYIVHGPTFQQIPIEDLDPAGV